MTKYKYLMAWDNLRGRDTRSKIMHQLRAENDNAPLDAIYRDANGKWNTFDDVQSKEERTRILSEIEHIR